LRSTAIQYVGIDVHQATLVCVSSKGRGLGGRVRIAFEEGHEALVDDSLRVMLRIRAIYRSRAISAKARSVYHPARRSE
jgi:hypothetical protein